MNIRWLLCHQVCTLKSSIYWQCVLWSSILFFFSKCIDVVLIFYVDKLCNATTAYDWCTSTYQVVFLRCSQVDHCVKFLLSWDFNGRLCLVRTMLFQFAYLSATAVDPPAFLGVCLQHVSDEGKIPDVEWYHILPLPKRVCSECRNVTDLLPSSLGV